MAFEKLKENLYEDAIIYFARGKCHPIILMRMMRVSDDIKDFLKPESIPLSTEDEYLFQLFGTLEDIGIIALF